MTLYKVMTNTVGEPEDAWSIAGKPERFRSVRAAERAIVRHIDSCMDAQSSAATWTAPPTAPTSVSTLNPKPHHL